MTLHRHFQKTASLFLGMITILSAAACGSYEYAGSDRDGIYASEPNVREEQQPTKNQPVSQTQEVQAKDSNYYANYFGQESEKIQEAQEMMFTDVESYSSNQNDSTDVEKDAYYNEAQLHWLNPG